MVSYEARCPLLHLSLQKIYIFSLFVEKLSEVIVELHEHQFIECNPLGATLEEPNFLFFPTAVTRVWRKDEVAMIESAPQVESHKRLSLKRIRANPGYPKMLTSWSDFALETYRNRTNARGRVPRKHPFASDFGSRGFHQP
jgi:hypothetical protein